MYMNKNNSKFQFTVGKLDAGMALLLSPDHHLIEFPATILPEGVTSGSIVNITINRDIEEENRKKKEFMELEEQIYKEFSKPPENPVIKVYHVTQTWVALEWEPLVLNSVELKEIDIFKNGQRIQTRRLSDTKVKISGLEMNTEYEFHVEIRTTGGRLKSNVEKVKTHIIDNLTGIRVCFGAFDNDDEIVPLIEALHRMGASFTDDVDGDNTHFVCSRTEGPKYVKATQLNIPIVNGQWLLACEKEGKIQPSSSFQVAQPAKIGE